MTATNCILSITESDSNELSAKTSSSSLGPTGKRLDYITWHQHHMYMARMLSEMSTEKQQDGCYIVDQEHYQIASGFAGEIKVKDGSFQCAICSAFHKMERKTANGDNFIMYITSFPDCDHCWKRIPNMKISKIWYWNLPGPAANPEAISTLQADGVQCEKYEPTRTISIDFHQ